MANHSAGNGGLLELRLARLTAAMETYVARGEVAGVITLIQRKGVVAHCDVIGRQDDAKDIALSRDSIFRIASMTKPVTCVAALMLMEEGRFGLDDAIEQWLPELANARVLRDPAGPLDDTVPAPRPVNVCDLFTHRPGFVSGLFAQGPIAKAAANLQSHMILLDQSTDLGGWLKRLGELPLCYAPGERINYGYTTDVLGMLVERVSGLPFADFLRNRLFEPLGMTDTAFFVPKIKRARFTTGYTVNPKDRSRILEDDPAKSHWGNSPKLPSGSAGLVSTADDYMQFASMLLAGGTLNGERFLSRKSIELMTSNFLTPAQRQQPFFTAPNYWGGQGFGLGVSVVDDPAQTGMLGSVGQYGWGGAYGTHWFNDPKEDMACVLMIQLLMADMYSKIKRDFQNLVYQAIDD